MYLRSQDILHVIFVLHRGGPVHFDLLLGLLLGFGFTKLYPKRHGGCRRCSVLVTCNGSLSPLLTQHFTESEQAAGCTGSLASCARNWAARGSSVECPALLRGPYTDLERNLSLDLSTAGWHYHCPGLHPHHTGAESILLYLYLKIRPLIVLMISVE